MRHLASCFVVASFALFSAASSDDDDTDGQPDGGSEDAGNPSDVHVAEQVVTGLHDAPELTVAVAEGNIDSQEIGHLLITSYTGSSACTFADPLGDAVEIRVNLERRSGCDYATVICTEEELCFSQSAGSAWAQIFEGNTLRASVRAVGGAVTLSREDIFSDTCDVEVEIGFDDGSAFTATYALEYHATVYDMCGTVTQ